MLDEIKKYENPGFKVELTKKMAVNSSHLRKYHKVDVRKYGINSKNVFYSEFPFPPIDELRFIHGTGTDRLQYITAADKRHQFGLTFEELLELNDFDLAVSKINAKTGYKGA